MVSTPSYLQLSRHGVYYLRVAIPEDLRPIYRKREIKLSLKTRIKQTALLGLIEQLVGDGVTVCFRKENLTFTGEQNPFQKLQLQIIGSCAEFEREMIRERQREGIAVARAKGKKFGRKPVINKALKDDIAKAIAAGEAKAAIAHRLGIGRATLYRALG